MRFPKTLTLLLLAMGLALALSAWAQQKPFTEVQVSNMVRDGFGDQSGAKLIEQRGIDFPPTEDFLQNLKAAGASAKKPINQVQVITLLAGQVSSRRVAMLVEERGIDFDVKDDYLQEVRLGGGDDELITALKSAHVTKPVTVDPAAQARQAEVRRHVVRGTQLAKKGQYAEAEHEYRAALLLDSHNADLYTGLAYILGQEKKWDDTVSAAREALRLDPNDDMAHNNLGVALGEKGDWDGAITVYRDALRLNPTNEEAHLNPGIALGNKSDWDGEITEEREALRLNPNLAAAHAGLGAALGHKRDWDPMIAEERDVLRLKPNDDMAHFGLAVALGGKNDWDGMITEAREALRLNPNNAYAHFGLGTGLEWKGDRRGALEEYREACTLDAKNAQFRQAYDHLSQPLSPPAQQGTQRPQVVQNIPPGSKLYIEPMNGFETYLAAAILAKKVPVTVVLDKAQADYVVTGSLKEGEGGFSGNGSVLRPLRRRTNYSLSASVVDPKSTAIVFSYSSQRSESHDASKEIAEDWARHLRGSILGKKNE